MSIKKIKAIIFLFVFLLFAGKGKADFDFVFEHLSIKDGLSHGSVSAMMKDSRGFMWFATWDGINRFDGRHFKTFKPDTGDGTIAASNRIETIREDKLGNIWVITSDRKAFRLNRLTWSFDAIPGNNTETEPAQVNGIYPVSNGDVWISTRNKGAYRIKTDSQTNHFIIYPYNINSKQPIEGNNIGFIYEDHQSAIWINTNNGLQCLEPDTITQNYKLREFDSQTQVLLKNLDIGAFYETNNYKYFGTKKGSLLVFYHKTKNFFEIDIRNNAPITSISGNNKGVLYIGTYGNGIFEYNELSGITTNHFNYSNIKNVLKTYPDVNGQLWVETNQAGISKINLATGYYRHYQQKLDVNPDVRPESQCGIMEDENQVLWLTLKGGGFGYYNPENDEVEYFFNKPGEPESKFSNFVNCFYKDASGVLWLSTYFKGLEKVTFIKEKFKFFRPNPKADLSISNEVRAIMQDSHGYFWVATKKQELFIVDHDFKTIKKINDLNGVKIGPVYTIIENRAGHIFLGTKGNGIFKLTRTNGLEFSFEHYLHDPQAPYSLSNNNIYALYEDYQNRIWVGTFGGGINLFDKNRFYHSGNQFKNYPKDRAMRVRHITADSDDNIWIGTTNGILIIPKEDKSLEEARFNLYNKENQNVTNLRSNDIFWIYCDQNKNIWIAAQGGGLSKLNQPKNFQKLEFTTLTKENGLPSDVIFTIVGDDNGNLWMSTENGISLYDYRNNQFRNFNQFDGVRNTFFSEAAMAKCSNGLICFGSYDGIYIFNHIDFKEQQKKINLVFTGFYLFGKEVIPGKEPILTQTISETTSLTLKHHQNIF